MRKLIRISVILLILASFILPAIPAMAQDEKTSTITSITVPDINIIEYPTYIEVNNGQFIFKFYQTYDEILNLDNSVAVYNNQFKLEYLQNTTWKQIGTPKSVSHTSDSVTRYYDNYIGTTYEVNYKFLIDKPVKITITVKSGQTNNFRLAWTPSGITNSTYINKTNQIEFGSIAFDWNDAYLTLGDITTSSVSTVAQGKKADIYFNVGIIEAGKTLIIDPSIVSTVLTNSPFFNNIYLFSKDQFYANGRHWVFYYSSSNLYYRTSIDGTNWDGAISIKAYDYGRSFCCVFDGTYFHIITVAGTYQLYYRRGIPNADGSITWSAAEQTIKTNVKTDIKSSLAVDSNGYAFATYVDRTSNKPYVLKNADNDGTWTTDSDTLMKDDVNYRTTLISLDNGKIFAINLGLNNAYEMTYDAGWSAENLISSNVKTYSLISYDNIIEVVFIDKTSLRPTNITYNAGWSGETEIIPDGNEVTINLSKTSNNDIYLSYVRTSTDYVYFMIKHNGTWSAEIPWINETVDAIPGTSSTVSEYDSMSRSPSLLYMSGHNPYELNFTLLPIEPETTTNNSTYTGITNSIINGEITNDGNDIVTTRGFQYGKTSGGPYSDWHEHGSFVTGDDYSINITGLEANTTYYYRAYSTNLVGTNYGNELSFKTLPDPEATSNILMQTFLPIVVSIAILITVLLVTGNPLAALTGAFTGLIAFYIILAFVQII